MNDAKPESEKASPDEIDDAKETIALASAFLGTEIGIEAALEFLDGVRGNLRDLVEGMKHE